MNDEELNDRNDGPDDVVLRARLRAAAPEPPVHAVDWSGLHARIMASAAPALGRPRADATAAGAAAPDRPRARPAPATWWQFTARHAFRGLPLSTAAAAVAALIVLVATVQRAPAPGEGVAAFVTVEEALYDGLPDTVRPVLVAGGDAAALLDAALFDDAEEW